MKDPITKIPVPIAPTYVNWSWWHAIRELFQNGLDAHDRGQTLIYSYDDATKKLLVRNVGSHLTRESIVLGATTKAGDSNQRGEFGEGYKLAITTLCRLGAKVQIHNGSELWVPEISPSEVFNTPILHIAVYPTSPSQVLTYEIDGLPNDEWRLIKSRILSLNAPYPTHVSTIYGKILTDPSYAGKLFVKGIYVSDLPDSHAFGYDIPLLKLDRDRQSPNTSHFRYFAARALKFAVEGGGISAEEMFEIVSRGQGEALALDSDKLSLVSVFHHQMVRAFDAKYGDNAIPVASSADATKAAFYTLQGVVVNSYLLGILGKVKSLSQKLIDSKILTVQRGYNLSDLSAVETDNLRWAIGLAGQVEPIDLAKMHVVDFVGNKLYGMYSRNSDESRVYLAKSILLDRDILIATLIHELCHKYGPDGDPAHRDAVEMRFAKLITMLCKVNQNGISTGN